MLSDLRRIYKELQIDLDYRDLKGKGLQGAYFPADEYGGPSVMVDRRLPDVPRISTLAHELKHHVMDGESDKPSYCSEERNENVLIEVGAGVFGAEFIWPEAEFVHEVVGRGIHPGECTPDDVVRMRHDSATTLSYQSMTKRQVRLRYAHASAFEGVKWTAIEERIYGIPIYKRMGRGGRKNNGLH